MSLPTQRPRFVPKREREAGVVTESEAAALRRESSALMLRALTASLPQEKLEEVVVRFPHLLEV